MGVETERMDESVAPMPCILARRIVASPPTIGRKTWKKKNTNGSAKGIGERPKDSGSNIWERA